MKLIMCISKNGGIAFNDRRQSRDIEVCRDMAALSAGKLYVSDYSAGLFSDIDGVQVCNDVSSLADQYYFSEKEVPPIPENEITEIILYHWNREYPADRFFDLDLNNFKLTETREFAGKSHEMIRRETWERK